MSPCLGRLAMKCRHCRKRWFGRLNQKTETGILTPHLHGKCNPSSVTACPCRVRFAQAPLASSAKYGWVVLSVADSGCGSVTGSHGMAGVIASVFPVNIKTLT